MAKLNIAERRLPQDGRIRLRVGEREIDLRVSTIPILHGESVVMRILDKESIVIDLDQLGFPPETLATFNRLIKKPNGIVLVTGPTGSGKTTTLYGALDKINSPDKKIITVEDPVEYQLKGRQPDTGEGPDRTELREYPEAHRKAGPRRDHDRRDQGPGDGGDRHPVRPHGPPGLFHPPHERCAERHHEAPRHGGRELPSLLHRQGHPRPAAREGHLSRTARNPTHQGTARNSRRSRPARDTPLFRGKGCEACAHTGYYGRQGIFELLIVDEEIRKMILKNADSNQIRQTAREGQGMKTLLEDGIEKVKSGRDHLERSAQGHPGGMMAVFSYRATTMAGETIEGVIEAPDEKGRHRKAQEHGRHPFEGRRPSKRS